MQQSGRARRGGGGAGGEAQLQCMQPCAKGHVLEHTVLNGSCNLNVCAVHFLKKKLGGKNPGQNLLIYYF